MFLRLINNFREHNHFIQWGTLVSRKLCGLLDRYLKLQLQTCRVSLGFLMDARQVLRRYSVKFMLFPGISGF